MSSGAAVNVPTNYRLKEQDVNAKLQLYGIFTAFANGKVPSNKQIDVAMNSTLASKLFAAPNKKLSAEGQHLVADFRKVVEEAKTLLLTRNQGNLIQDFIWQTEQLSAGGVSASGPNAPISKDAAQQHGQQALEGLRTLGTLLISNGQFRKLLSDASILLRDIAGDAASKTASKVNPGQDELAQIDQAADDNTWHDVPDMSRDNIRNQAKSTFNQNKPISRGDLKEAAGDASQEAHPSGSRDPADAADLAARDQQRGTDSGVDAKSGAMSAAQKLKDRVKQNVPDDKQDQAADTTRQYKDRTANYLKDKMPQERRDQTIWRLKKMVVEIQGHQDYAQAIDTLLRLAEEYSGHSKNLANQSASTVQGARSDNNLARAETDLKTIIERFANNSSLDDVFDSINQIYRDADRDPELKGWFRKLDTYIRKCLQEQGFILQDAATEQWNTLYDQGNYLLRDKYRNHTDHILDEFKYYADQFDKDPQNKRFGDSVQKLLLDLGQDDNGKPAFKPHLIKDLTEVILPAFFENIRYVPIPRIEYKDAMVDAVIENLVLEGDNLAPNMFEFGSDNYWRWGRKQYSNKNKNKVMLSVSGVQCDLRDVSYYIKKKQGFPGVTDKGVMDIILAGSGLSFKIAMETADGTDKQHFFKVNTIDVSIKQMNIILKQSNHKLLFKLFKPLLLKVMTPIITKVIEKLLKDQIHKADGQLYQIYKEANRIKEQAKNDPENAGNIFQNYTDAVKSRLTQKKQKAQAAKEKAGEVNIAMSQHDSIFPNIRLPGGISTKATEYKDLALKGDKWESPVFSIGSSKESAAFAKTAAAGRRGLNSAGHGSSNTGGNLPVGAGAAGAAGGAGYGSATGGAGYGSSTGGAGYGSGNGGTGYGSTTGEAGYGQGVGRDGYESGVGGAGYGSGSGLTGQGQTSGLAGTGNGSLSNTQSNTQGFRNEVDQAFGEEKVAPTTGSTTGQQRGGTTLGINNPVLNGQA